MNTLPPFKYVALVVGIGVVTGAIQGLIVHFFLK